MRVLPFVLALLVIAPAEARPPKRVVCHAAYGGEQRDVVAVPTTDPYAQPEIELWDRFRLKVIWVDHPADEARLAIYAYRDTDTGPVLLSEVIYKPPLPTATGVFGFTGKHLVYEPGLGRELSWWCEWAR